MQLWRSTQAHWRRLATSLTLWPCAGAEWCQEPRMGQVGRPDTVENDWVFVSEYISKFKYLDFWMIHTCFCSMMYKKHASVIIASVLLFYLCICCFFICLGLGLCLASYSCTRSFKVFSDWVLATAPTSDEIHTPSVLTQKHMHISTPHSTHFSTGNQKLRCVPCFGCIALCL